MKPYKNNDRPSPCRKCGGTDFALVAPANTHNLPFVHVRRKCKQCGTWCGGYTHKNKAKEAVPTNQGGAAARRGSRLCARCS